MVLEPRVSQNAVLHFWIWIVHWDLAGALWEVYPVVAAFHDFLNNMYAVNILVVGCMLSWDSNLNFTPASFFSSISIALLLASNLGVPRRCYVNHCVGLVETMVQYHVSLVELWSHVIFFWFPCADQSPTESAGNGQRPPASQKRTEIAHVCQLGSLLQSYLWCLKAGRWNS